MKKLISNSFLILCILHFIAFIFVFFGSGLGFSESVKNNNLLYSLVPLFISFFYFLIYKISTK